MRLGDILFTTLPAYSQPLRHTFLHLFPEKYRCFLPYPSATLFYIFFPKNTDVSSRLRDKHRSFFMIYSIKHIFSGIPKGGCNGKIFQVAGEGHDRQ